MNVVDSSGWIEFLTDGQLAQEFARPLTDAAHLIVPSVCVFEVCKFTIRTRGRREALEVLAQMRRGAVIDLDDEISFLAADISHSHALPLADSVILATARIHRASLWTADAHFERLTDVRYFRKK